MLGLEEGSTLKLSQSKKFLETNQDHFFSARMIPSPKIGLRRETLFANTTTKREDGILTAVPEREDIIIARWATGWLLLSIERKNKQGIVSIIPWSVFDGVVGIGVLAS